MDEAYQVIGKGDRKKLTEFLCRHGQLLVQMVGMIEQCKVAVDETGMGVRTGFKAKDGTEPSAPLTTSFKS